MQQIETSGQNILEELIVQHDTLNAIYPNVVNTLRLHTINNGQNIRLFLLPKLRIGCDGSHSDTGGKAGSYRVILNIDGSVRYAVRVNANQRITKAQRHHNTRCDLRKINLPYLPESIAMVIEAANYFPELPFIGWDVAITPNGPVIVEGNSISGAMQTYQTIIYLYEGHGIKTDFEEMMQFLHTNSD